MQSFLIIGYSHAKSLQAAQKICDEHHIHHLDQKEYNNPDRIIASETKKADTTGIGMIRSLKEQIILKPFAGNIKAVILHHADQLSLPAQNALLKLLEEPPAHTLLFLLAKTKDAMLPTIQSRCTIITLEQEALTLSSEDRTGYELLITSLKTGSMTAKLNLVDVIQKETSIIVWLEKLIHFSKEKMQQSLNREDPKTILWYRSLLQKALATYDVLVSTNTNQKLTIEHFLLSL